MKRVWLGESDISMGGQKDDFFEKVIWKNIESMDLKLQ